jgi:uncharacterized membrane protein YidH (DUF202 family)
MHVTSEKHLLDPKLDQFAGILQITGWLSFCIQLSLAIVSGLMLALAISSRNFSQAVNEVEVASGSSATTPGISIGIFWAICGILVLLFGAYLAFRYTRFAKQLRNPNFNPLPIKTAILQVLQLGTIVGLVGMLLSILGDGSTLGVLLSKSIAQPQGMTVYDPTRIIRSLDIFVAMANLSEIAAHFVGMVASLSLFKWLHE